MNKFKKKYMNAKGWSAYRSYERHQLTFKIVEFLRQALSYAKEFPRLSNEIFHPNTVYAEIKVLAKDLYNNIRKFLNLLMISTQVVNRPGRSVLAR